MSSELSFVCLETLSELSRLSRYEVLIERRVVAVDGCLPRVNYIKRISISCWLKE